MKNFNFLSKLCGSLVGSQSSDLSLDYRLTVGSPSFDCRSAMLKLVSVLVLILTVGVGNVWGGIAYGTYVEATALEAGAHYILTGVKNSTTYSISNVNNANNRRSVSVTLSNGKISLASNSTACTFTLGGSNNAWTFTADNYLNAQGNETSNCYLRATSSSSNYLGLTSDNLTNEARWTIGSFSSGTATMVANGDYSRKKVRFNPNGNSAAIFGAYATNTSAGTDVKFYRKAVQGVSDNTTYGTVSIAGDVITATPASGYRVRSTTPYTISPANSATVSQSGNVFTVTPTALTTITIYFEAAASCSTNPTAGSASLNGSFFGTTLFEPVRPCVEPREAR